MSVFEDKIRRNKSYFDNHEPEKGHKDRFLEKLDELNAERKQGIHYRTILSIAAVLVVLITAGTMIYQYFSGTQIDKEQMVEKINYSENLENVMAYYDAVSLQKVDQIDKLVRDPKKAREIRQVALNRLDDIDGSLASIEKELAKNPENENVKSALINNKRKKVEVMDDILIQLDLANSSLF